MEKNHTYVKKKKKRLKLLYMGQTSIRLTVSITILKMLIVSTKHSVDVLANVLSGFIDF